MQYRVAGGNKTRYGLPLPVEGFPGDLEEDFMDKDQVVGSAEKIKGTVKEVVG